MKNNKNKNKNKELKKTLVGVLALIFVFLLLLFILFSAFTPMMVSAIENTETLTETEKITDLSGTSWVLNDTVTLNYHVEADGTSTYQKEYYVNFTCNGIPCYMFNILGYATVGIKGIANFRLRFASYEVEGVSSSLSFYTLNNYTYNDWYCSYDNDIFSNSNSFICLEQWPGNIETFYDKHSSDGLQYRTITFSDEAPITDVELIDFVLDNFTPLDSFADNNTDNNTDNDTDNDIDVIIDGWNDNDSISFYNFGPTLDCPSVFYLTDTQTIYFSFAWAESGVKPYVFIRYLLDESGDLVRYHFSYDSYADALYYGISPNVRIALGSYSYIADEVVDFSTMPFYGEHDNLTVYQESDYPFSCLNGDIFSGYTIVWDDLLYGGYAIMYKYANPKGQLDTSDVVYTERDGWINDVYRYILGDESFVDYFTEVVDGDELLINSYAYEFMTLNYKLDNIPYDTYYHLVYSSGYDAGYPIGYKLGYDVASASVLGKNLLGDTLLAPVRALDSIVLYTSSNGFRVTLWGVFGTVVGVSLFIWFMKMFLKG